MQSSFELVHRDVRTALPLAAQRLLALLALRPPPLRRSEVAGTLWPQLSEQRADAKLRPALQRVQGIGRGVVHVTGTHLQLGPVIDVDLRASEAAARRVLARDGAEVADADLASLLQGDVLPEWHDDWVVFERERFRQLRLKALDAACEQLIVAGRLGDALDVGLAALAIEPLREGSHRTLVRIHLADANASEALRQYRMCRRLLGEQLGIEPSQQMEQLIRGAVKEASRGIRGTRSLERARPGLSRTVPSVFVRCFGEFRIDVDGRTVELASIKPRARQMLRLLALHGGRPVHREVIVEALWPQADRDAANRLLHVAVSSLRRLFEQQVGHQSALISRDGESYRLALPPTARVDLLEFESAVREGRMARALGDADRAIAAFRTAMEIHDAELLPEDGPVEWLVYERARCAAEACEAAEAVAELLLERGDCGGAAVACERGLRVDRYRDTLWRVRIEAHERAGNLAASRHTRREYEQVLRDSGLRSPPPIQVAIPAAADGQVGLERRP